MFAQAFELALKAHTAGVKSAAHLLAHYWRVEQGNEAKAREVINSAGVAQDDPFVVFQRLRLKVRH